MITYSCYACGSEFLWNETGVCGRCAADINPDGSMREDDALDLCPDCGQPRVYDVSNNFTHDCPGVTGSAGPDDSELDSLAWQKEAGFMRDDGSLTPDGLQQPGLQP